MLREADIDVVMLAINLADRYTYNFENEVLPLAYEQNVGVAAMKVYGGAQGMTYQTPRTSALAAHGSHDHEAALRAFTEFSEVYQPSADAAGLIFSRRRAVH